MAQGGSNKKVANSLVALSSAAVLSVYSAGYVRTRSAAERFVVQAAERRPPAPVPQPVPLTVAALPTAPAMAAIPEPPAKKQERVPQVAAPRPQRAPEIIEKASTPVEPVPHIEANSPAALEPAPAPSVAEAVPAPIVPKTENLPTIPPTPPAPAVPPVPAAPAQPKWKDGTYHGWGTSRHGNIEAAVVIEGGRIASATISQCLTRYSCDVIDKLPPQVALRQSPDIDTVGGATQSADAFYYAVAEALTKAK